MLKVLKCRCVKVSMLKCSLSKEFESKFDFYKGFSTESCNMRLELENFLKKPLEFYDCDTGDILLMALGNAFNVNVIIYQSNVHRCWKTDLTNENKNYSATLYFPCTWINLNRIQISR